MIRYYLQCDCGNKEPFSEEFDEKQLIKCKVCGSLLDPKNKEKRSYPIPQGWHVKRPKLNPWIK